MDRATLAKPRQIMAWSSPNGTVSATALTAWGISLGGFTGTIDSNLPFQNHGVADGVSSPTSYVYVSKTYNALTEDAYLTEVWPMHAALGGVTWLRHRVQACDILWMGPQASYTATPTAISSPTLPARDVNGATNGEGCLLAVFVSAASGTVTVGYTNSAGVSGRTATQAISVTSGPWILPLENGDTGVKSIQSLTSTTTMNAMFIIYRPLMTAMYRDNQMGSLANNLQFVNAPVVRQLSHVPLLKAGTLLFPLFNASQNTSDRHGMGVSLVVP